MIYPFWGENLKNIASLISIAGSIKGRKKLQKIVFILKTLGAPFYEKFKLYHFGPYSVDLQLELDELVLLGVISEKWDSNLCTYSFKNVEEKESFLKNPKISEYHSVIDKLNKTDASILELLSTYLYLIENEENELIAKKKLKIIKPHIFNKFEEALKLWGELT